MREEYPMPAPGDLYEYIEEQSLYMIVERRDQISWWMYKTDNTEELTWDYDTAICGKHYRRIA